MAASGLRWLKNTASGAVVAGSFRFRPTYASGGHRRRPGAGAREDGRDRDGDGCGGGAGRLCGRVGPVPRQGGGGRRRAVLLARAGARGRESDACVSWSRAGESHGRHGESVRGGAAAASWSSGARNGRGGCGVSIGRAHVTGVASSFRLSGRYRLHLFGWSVCVSVHVDATEFRSGRLLLT